MSKIEQLVNTLKNNITVVLQKHSDLKQQNKQLHNTIKAQENEILELQQHVSNLSSKYETLKVANTLLGSNTNKRDTKLKINALIRDIDHCISQLNK